MHFSSISTTLPLRFKYAYQCGIVKSAAIIDNSITRHTDIISDTITGQYVTVKRPLPYRSVSAIAHLVRGVISSRETIFRLAFRDAVRTPRCDRSPPVPVHSPIMTIQQYVKSRFIIISIPRRPYPRLSAAV